jgi:hypothetical protein
VSWIFAPLKKIIDSPLRPIAIPDDEREFSASFLCTFSRAFAAGWLRIHSAAR